PWQLESGRKKGEYRYLEFRRCTGCRDYAGIRHGRSDNYRMRGLSWAVEPEKILEKRGLREGRQRVENGCASGSPVIIAREWQAGGPIGGLCQSVHPAA